MKQQKRVSSYRYLIIGGTTKAATTSLFTYIAAHPAICAATYKETRFFLSDAYPLPSKYRYKGDAEEYNLLFPEAAETECRLESTPDYLYCEEARERIASELPNAKIVFSLREPISRLVSWYRFAQQNGNLPQTVCVDSYIDQLFKAGTAAPQFLRILEQGRYPAYLMPYLNRFGPDRVHILFYEDLAAQPAEVMTALCTFAGLSDTFYTGYPYRVTNRSQPLRHAAVHQHYRALRYRVRQWTHNKPLFHQPLRYLKQALEPLYLRLNSRPSEKTEMSAENRHRLLEYYTPAVQALREVIRRPLPWKNYTS